MRFQFPDSHSGTHFLEQLKSNSTPVVLFGAGAVGELAYDFLQEQQIEVMCIGDNNGRLHGRGYRGCPIVSPEALMAYQLPVLICSKYEREIRDQLLAMHAANVISACRLFDGVLIEGELLQNHLQAVCSMKVALDKEAVVRQRPDALILNNVDVVITERCSLRCQDCANLMQYYAHPDHEDMERLFYALDRLMTMVDWVGELRVIGGEPFMHKQVARYVEKCLSYKNSSFVEIYSNGTIMPEQKAWVAMDDDKAVLLLSDYGPLSSKLEQITQLAEGLKIKYRVAKMDEWQDCGRIMEHHRNVAELQMVYGQCCARNIWTLKDGRLYGCPFSANGTKLKAIPDFVEDYVDLTQDEVAENLREKIKTLAEKKYYQACQYCNGRPIAGLDVVPVAVQSKQPLAYKKYDR